MELFNKKFVYFMWDDSLKDKECFVADDICSLKTCVENNIYAGIRHVIEPESDNESYPFTVSIDEGHKAMFRFVYYDPNYTNKVAFNEGKKIQFKSHVYNEWTDTENPYWNDKYKYRVKPDEEKKLKWQDLEIGDVIRNKTTGIKSLITAVNDEDRTDKHIYIRDFWLLDDTISDYEKVDLSKWFLCNGQTV